MAERRSIFQDLKLSGWFNAFRLRGFEECEISRCKIVNPSGAGTALLVSAPGSGGQRAKLHVIGCVLRGNDDVVQNAPTGLWGVQAFDVDALPAVIGGLFVFAGLVSAECADDLCIRLSLVDSGRLIVAISIVRIYVQI